ncbi:D-allose-binding periplasmic protein precursor [Aquimixticola soesokkakensis]|uniref:D-allose-binding periplasmic protein n=1 Tax=Aquimixticola soesokkakensis TaxID=1519096 RepID=A0A1Y5TI28_9RHOB|nr:LacI family DNA-binding transcriptional regulator [Aquimixticola soesokkakensis]SLN62531.1 D-allose-binding periplasmic protein precursor [Aquimixticola soesokkakensis]
MTRKITAADVARAAGVSPATVDRVLNGRGGVAAEKERRVLVAARDLKIDRALDLRVARTLRIAVFLQPRRNPFHAALQAAFMAHNTGSNPYNMQSRIFHLDPGQPAKIMAALAQAESSHDAFVVCLPESAGLAAALDGLAERGKPVVTLATDIGAAQAVYVGPDNYRAGRVAGDLIGRLVGAAGGEVLVVAGFLSMTGQSERRMGCEDVLAERYPLCRVVAVRESGEDSARAGRLVTEALARSPGLRAIYNASSGAVPMAQALERAGQANEVVFVTHELTPERRELLVRGTLHAVIDQSPAQEVRVALEVLAHAFGRRVDAPTPETPLHLYFRENC